MDSVALLVYLWEERECYGYALSAVHCEHGLRGEESLADMRFVEQLCANLNIPLFLFREDCAARAKREKESVETAARNFRYEGFERLVREGKADVVATAHHLSDEAETVLFRIVRGSALSGMKGISPMRGHIVRPILDWTKADVETFVKTRNLAYRVDSSNGDLAYSRNKIRLEVLPKLEEISPRAKENIARFARLAAEDDELLYDYARALLSPCDEGYAVRFSEKKPLFTRACLLAIKALGLEKDYAAAHLDALFRLQEAERGAKIDLPQEIEGVRGDNEVLLRRKKETPPTEKPTARPVTDGRFDGGRYEVTLSSVPLDGVEYVGKVLRMDEAKLPEGACFRFREVGDEIRSFGGTKSLKKFLNEKKIPVEEREYLPLLAKGNEVYAVCGVEISERIKTDASTGRETYIYLRKKSEV